MHYITDVFVYNEHRNNFQKATFKTFLLAVGLGKGRLWLHPELLTGRTVYSGSRCYGDSWSFHSASPNRQRGVRRRNRVISGSGTGQLLQTATPSSTRGPFYVHTNLKGCFIRVLLKAIKWILIHSWNNLPWKRVFISNSVIGYVFLCLARRIKGYSIMRAPVRGFFRSCFNG